MKILILSGSLRQSGSSTWAINLARAFSQIDHEAVLLIMGEAGEVNIPADVKVVFLGKARTHPLVRCIHLLQLRKLSKRTFKKLEEWVYSQRVKKFLGTFENNSKVDLIIKNFTTVTPKSIGDRNHLAVIHQMLADSNWDTDRELRKRAQDKVTTFAAVSQATANDAKSKGIAVGKVLYNPIDIDSLRKRAVAFPVEDDYIVFVGCLNKGKGVHELLQAWYRSGIPQKLYYVGRGHERKALEKEAAALGVKDRVIFTGFQSNPMPYIKNAKMLVLASATYEAMPYVCFEAVALKTSIVVAGFNGAKEFYDDINIVPLTPANSFVSRLAVKLSTTLKHENTYTHSQSMLKKMVFSNVANEYLKILNH